MKKNQEEKEKRYQRWPKKVQDELIRTTRSQRERFEYALDQVVGKTHIRDGIGTLSEKTVHAVLKYYYEPDSSHHEIPLEKGCR